MSGFRHRHGPITHDPVTGDELTAAEAAAWRVQWIIRRWAFITIVTLVTAVCWAIVAVANSNTVLTWWNCVASYLALVIESVVGMAMYHQTQRDAQVTREIRKLTKTLHELAEEIMDLQLRSER